MGGMFIETQDVKIGLGKPSEKKSGDKLTVKKVRLGNRTYQGEVKRAVRKPHLPNLIGYLTGDSISNVTVVEADTNPVTSIVSAEKSEFGVG